jgi:predicted DNA-binding transcriptional regulator YafY
MKKQPTLKFVYTNWQGETAERSVIPIKIWYGKTDFHPKEQWFLKAIDVEKNAQRDFALKDIKSFL